MTDEDREQSPHYIPELDPENRKHRPAWLERTILWIDYLAYIVFAVATVIAVTAWFKGWSDLFMPALTVAAISGLMIAITLLG